MPAATALPIWKIHTDILRTLESGNRLVLVAPYLCYMRQDKVFRPGEPLSRDVMAGWLRKAFDRVITVDPHLHRTHDLAALFPLLFDDDDHRWLAAIDDRTLERTAQLLCPQSGTTPWRDGLLEGLYRSGLVLDEARRNGARLPVTALVDQFYADVQAAGGQRWDTSSLITRLR